MFDMSQGQLVSQFLLHKNNGEDYTPREMESTLVERSEENKLEDIVQDVFLTSCDVTSSVSPRKLPSPTPDLGVQQHYIRVCNKYGAIPVSYFLRHVKDDKFVMRFHGLGPLGAKAISRQLESNTYIQTLDLEGNCINSKGALYLASSLRDNFYITHLNLADNSMGNKGTSAIIEMMRENSTITNLNISGNDLSDRDGRIFFYLLKHNHFIRSLDVSHNNLGDLTADWLTQAFDLNEGLVVLDLSWNHFRRNAAVQIGNILASNRSLQKLYLSMNGLGPEGACAIGRALCTNDTLHLLDISANRIPTTGALVIATALEQNNNLKILKMGKNPISPAGALTLLQAVQCNTSSSLELLDIEGVNVPLEFEALEEHLLKERNLNVIRGRVIAKRRTFKGRHRPPPPEFEDLSAAYEKDPMTKLRKYCMNRQIRLLDLFKQFDKDNSWSVSIEELKRGIKSIGIDMSDEDMDSIVVKLDKDGDGDIDYRELATGDKLNKRERIKVAKHNREQQQQLKDHYEAQAALMSDSIQDTPQKIL